MSHCMSRRSWLNLTGRAAAGLSFASPLFAAVRPTGAAQREDIRRGQVVFDPSKEEHLVPASFQLKAHEFPFEASRMATLDGTLPYWEVTFPSPVETPYPNNNRVHCEYFPPQAQGRRPGVIVLHILGGDFELSRLCCRALSLSGSGALFVKMPYYGPRRQPESTRRMISLDPRETVAGMRQAVLDIRRAAAWLAQQPNIDNDRLGISGISLGGIMSALGAAAEPRLASVCLVLAGGDIGRVVWETDELKKVRQHWESLGLTRETVVDLLRSVDPVTYADRLRGRRILMLNASHDEVIPRACTESLWRALGEPEIVWWNAGHISAAFYLPDGLRRMCTFFSAEAPVLPRPLNRS